MALARNHAYLRLNSLMLIANAKTASPPVLLAPIQTVRAPLALPALPQLVVLATMLLSALLLAIMSRAPQQR